MMGWDHAENGPAGVFRELKKASKDLDLQDIQFISLSGKKTRVLKNILKVVAQNNGETICVHSGPYLLCAIVCLLSRVFRKNKYYLVAHGIYILESPYMKKTIGYVKYCEKYIYKNFDNIICVSELCEKQIRNFYGRTNNITVIENGFTSNNILADDRNDVDELKLIFLGGIKRIKGCFEAIELVDYIQDNIKLPVKLHFWGGYNDDDYSNFKQMTKERDAVIYCGIIKEKEKLLETVSHYDIHLALSYQDTFNVAIPEAMSVGVPTISTNMCGASSLIENNKNGLVINLQENYKEAVAQYIEKYVGNANFRKSNRKQAVESVQGKEWNRVMQKYYKMLI